MGRNPGVSLEKIRPPPSPRRCKNTNYLYTAEDFQRTPHIANGQTIHRPSPQIVHLKAVLGRFVFKKKHAGGDREQPDPQMTPRATCGAAMMATFEGHTITEFASDSDFTEDLSVAMDMHRDVLKAARLASM